MKEYDYEIIQKGNFHIIVIRDEFTTAVYTCDSYGIITPPGNRLMKTHITYEQNCVAFRHIVGKMKNKPEEPGTYFGATEPRVCHKMEVDDNLKVYDDKNDREHIYVNDKDYQSIDGSRFEHMMESRKKFKDTVIMIQSHLLNEIKMNERVMEALICGL